MIETKYPHLFTPVRVGNLLLKNRIFASPTSLNWLAKDGCLTDETIAYYEEKAKGGAAVVTMGECVAHGATGKSHDRQLCLDNPDSLIGLAQLARAIKRHGAVPSAQISHGGKWGGLSSMAGGLDKAGVAYGAYDEILPEGEVKQMPRELIEEIAESFGKGAAVLQRAGFEMCMVHAGHGWLFGQFLSPKNQRNDEFGGSFENRARFLMMALDSIRAHVGRAFPIELRISGDEFTEDGIKLEEAIKLVKMVEDKVNIINVSAGMHENPELFIRTHPTSYLPKAANVYLAEAIKKETNLLVSTVGGIVDPELMEEIVATGKADIVLLGRPLLADPQFVNKIRTGRDQDLVRCLRCNGCFGESIKTGLVNCVLNPVPGNEVYNNYITNTTTTPKKVMVVGGGPGGMYAAITAAQRGHAVSLYEKRDQLGGALKFAEFVDFKNGLHVYKETLKYKLSQTDVKIHLNATVTKDTVAAEKPDVLIIAVGGTPIIPPIKGIDSPKVILAEDSFGKEDQLGEKIVVLGGGLVGCETAAHLAREGKQVAIVEMREDVAIDADPFGQAAVKVDMRKNHVRLVVGAAGKEITDEGLVVTINGVDELIPADNILVAVGYRANQSVLEELVNEAPIVKDIGDCHKPGKVTNAVFDGYFNAMDI